LESWSVNMPELPEVEILRQYVNDTSIRQIIEKVDVKDPRILEGISANGLANALNGRQIQSTTRHGKLLFMKLEDDLWLALHLGMTGWLYYFRNMKAEPVHDRLLITFAGGAHLAYSDQRLFGRWTITKQPRLFVNEKRLGPDFLELSLSAFVALMRRRRGFIKPALLDQHFIAGLGNLYSDEGLFQSGICPNAELRCLSEDRLECLFGNIQMILKTAISSRMDIGSLPDFYLLPHRLPGRRCPKDGNPLMYKKIAGRTTYYCPQHHKM
jgi:formamidopyrimidine-DNA glycosylase